jgi:hypothetical protein
MIPNLEYAARNRLKVWIGGGEFGPAELTLAAQMMTAYAPMLQALRAAEGILVGWEDDPGSPEAKALALVRAALALPPGEIQA